MDRQAICSVIDEIMSDRSAFFLAAASKVREMTPLAGRPTAETGCTGPTGPEWSVALPPFPGAPELLGLVLQVAARPLDPPRLKFRLGTD